MLMSYVKAITLPEGSVKQIQDSNGNILWGSYDAFPYRKLKYIYLNGTDNYIQTDFYAGTNGYNYQCDFSTDATPTGSGAQTLLGIYDSTLTDALRRWYLIWQGPNGIRCSLGNTWSSYATAFNETDILKVSYSYSKSGNTPRGYWYLNNVSTSTSIGTANPITGTTAGDVNTTTALKLGCQISQTGNPSNYWNGKIYSFQRRQGGSSGTLTHNYVPCQRKSDEKYGVYDTISNTFLALEGTQVTATGGPVVDEYWDLTA